MGRAQWVPCYNLIVTEEHSSVLNGRATAVVIAGIGQWRDGATVEQGVGYLHKLPVMAVILRLRHGLHLAFRKAILFHRNGIRAAVGQAVRNSHGGHTKCGDQGEGFSSLSENA